MRLDDVVPGRFRVRCSMPYRKCRRSLLRTFRARVRRDRGLSPDSPSARWCGSPAPPPPSITWCSPTVCSGSARSPRTSSGWPSRTAIARSPPSHRMRSEHRRRSDVLPVATFPPRRRADRRGGSSGVVCPLGARRAIGYANTAVLVGDALPLDSGDTGCDACPGRWGRAQYRRCLPSSRSQRVCVRSVGITGDAGSGGPLYLMTDSGVLFGVHDENAAEHLGLPSTPVPAPWPVLALLPMGRNSPRVRQSCVTASRRRRSRSADAVIATVATATTTQIAAPEKATCRGRGSGGSPRTGDGARRASRFEVDRAAHRGQCIDHAVTYDGDPIRRPAGGRCLRCAA